MSSIPQRGEVWWVDLDPTEGDEQKKTRPCLVISVDRHNQITRSPLNVVLAIPLSRTIREDVPWHVPYKANELDLDDDGAILCDQTRALALERFEDKAGEVQPDSHVLRLVLDRYMVLTGYY